MVLDAVGEANALYRRYGYALRADKKLAHLLHVYAERIGETFHCMQQAEVVAACSACAQETGSCCFQEVETWYDPVLLLCNLLLGVALPDRHDIAGQCLFLGRSGCKLHARYAFCINYLCPRLRADLRDSEVQRFLAVAGREISAGWELECALRKWLSSHPGPRPGGAITY